MSLSHPADDSELSQVLNPTNNIGTPQAAQPTNDNGFPQALYPGAYKGFAPEIVSLFHQNPVFSCLISPNPLTA